MNRKLNKVLAVSTGSVYTVVGVVTNPFKRDRHSARHYFHDHMAEWSDMDLYTDVKECPDCGGEFGYCGLNMVQHRAGEKMDRMFLSYGQEERFYTKDTYCPVHWPRVREYQHHIMGKDR